MGTRLNVQSHLTRGECPSVINEFRKNKRKRQKKKKKFKCQVMLPFIFLSEFKAKCLILNRHYIYIKLDIVFLFGH